VGGSRKCVLQTGLTLNGTTKTPDGQGVLETLTSRTPPEMTNLKSSRHQLVFVGNGEPDVNGREDRENIGLNHRNENMQPDKQNRNE
jgi:hypothetical protein